MIIKDNYSNYYREPSEKNSDDKDQYRPYAWRNFLTYKVKFKNIKNFILQDISGSS